VISGEATLPHQHVLLPWLLPPGTARLFEQLSGRGPSPIRQRVVLLLAAKSAGIQ
jgi:hypothetical protein